MYAPSNAPSHASDDAAVYATMHAPSHATMHAANDADAPMSALSSNADGGACSNTANLSRRIANEKM